MKMYLKEALYHELANAEIFITGSKDRDTIREI